ncbi:MAG: hypothetical protein LBL66_10345 [Clostridiales bacterium]|nr:hypothetical protein [Clostridiales bacterium]
MSLILYGAPGFSVFSLCMSGGYAIICLLSNAAGILTVKYGKVSVYSVFAMLGGMLLPYLCGIVFWEEKPSVCQIVGLVVLVCALPLSVVNRPAGIKRSSAKIYYILCALIFVLNGSLNIVSKLHSINGSVVRPGYFIVYMSVFLSLYTGVLYFVFGFRVDKMQPKKDAIEEREQNGGEKAAKSSENGTGPETAETAEEKTTAAKAGALQLNRLYLLLTVTCYTVFSGGGFLLTLIAAKTAPAVALYPFLTGGGIVLCAVLARIVYKERITRFAGLGIVLSLGGTILFLF